MMEEVEESSNTMGCVPSYSHKSLDCSTMCLSLPLSDCQRDLGGTIPTLLRSRSRLPHERCSTDDPII